MTVTRADGLGMSAGADVLVQEYLPDDRNSPLGLSQLPCLIICGAEPDNPEALHADIASGDPLRPVALLGPDYSIRDLEICIEALLLGLSVVAPEFRWALQPGSEPANPGKGISNTTGELLNDQERALLALLGSGLSNVELGERVGVSANTIKFHLKSIYAKLGVHARSEAVYVGLQRGLIAL